MAGTDARPSARNPIRGPAPGSSRQQHRIGKTFRDDPKGLFVDSTELPAATWIRIAPHFGLSLSAPDVVRMREAALYDAKNPGMPFPPLSAAG